MTSAIIATPAFSDTSVWDADLQTVGIQVLGNTPIDKLLPAAIRSAPDLVICFENHPDDALFDNTSALERSAPRPVLVFTTDPTAENIDRAARSGIHAYIINGYGLHRLRSVIQVAQARFRHEQLLREELTDVHQKFAERKLVDRAKGILMGARQVREDEAFRMLRGAAMNTKQRIGQVARQIIDASRFAEAVNRSGQLRMLSQRLVKLYGLLCAGIDVQQQGGLFADSLEHMDRNLSILSRTLSKATFGDLLASVLEAAKQLRAALSPPAAPQRLGAIDAHAETLLDRAERLTTNLEIAGLVTNLRVVNVSGRQRMLAQRMGKQVVLRTVGAPPDAPAFARQFEATERDFVEALAYLSGTPLATPEIVLGLASAQQHWDEYRPALQTADLARIAVTSEIILGDFDRLTDAYERALQALFA